MTISNIFIAGEAGEKEIRIENGKIMSVTRADENPASPSLSLAGAIAFPGLINSHDHLDFNLFPAMGNTIYANYTQWGNDIHAQNNPGIRAVLAIPQALRVRWGMYKNLINGITTVVNHGEWLDIGEDNLGRVFQQCYCLHSPGFEKNLKWQLNRPRARRWPLVLHVGEGTDDVARKEIDRLLRWNLFKKPLIGIHGVAMDEQQATGFRALVWCPASNYFLLDRTAPVERLKKKLPVLFGTDSTLTAGWNAWEHFRLARECNGLTDRELLDSLTTAPASTWGLSGSGAVAAGLDADLVIAQPGPATNPASGSLDAFFGINPGDIQLVIRKGIIRLFDEDLYDALACYRSGNATPHHHGGGQPAAAAAGPDLTSFSRITVQGRRKFIAGDLPGLMEKVREYHPGAEFPVSAA
jgi:cytosine/adenosine deaminase-related metal-dependent hydrolase